MIKILFFCFVPIAITSLLLIECNSFKHSNVNSKSSDLYVNIVPMGWNRQYLLFDSSSRIAYYFFDSVNTCDIIEKRIREKYRQIGDYNIVNDSIKFSFDSCASTTSTGYYFSGGVKHSYTHRIWDYNFPQRYCGRIAGDTIYFLLISRDTLHWNETYVRCKK
jgi:hypothetical protein